MSRALVGLILAGGGSTRFGREKAAAVLEDRPLLAHAHAALADACAAVAVSARPGSAAERLAGEMGLAVLHDAPDAPAGPLAGVAAGLDWARVQGASRLAILPCDTPWISPEVVARLDGALGPADGVAAARTADGLHALCAVIRLDRTGPLLGALDRGEHPPVRDAWAAVGLRIVDFEDASAFRNVNRPQDLP